MTFPKRISILALLYLTSNAAWSEPVNLCKVKRIYDDDINVPVKIEYEDCSGVAFRWYAKAYVKASCWEGAIDLLEGKCELHENDYKEASTVSPGTEEAQEEKQD